MERGMKFIVPVVALATVLSFPLTGLAWLDPAQPDVVTVLDSEDDGLPPSAAKPSRTTAATPAAASRDTRTLMFMKFDLSAYRGQTVEAAELHLCRSIADTRHKPGCLNDGSDWHEGGGTAPGP